MFALSMMERHIRFCEGGSFDFQTIYLWNFNEKGESIGREVFDRVDVCLSLLLLSVVSMGLKSISRL